jgi:cysteine desulfurase
MKKIYFDNAATTKVRREVIETMLPYFDCHYGNPAGIHSYSREAEHAIEKAREIIAKAINTSPEEIIFTSGGTESNNLAIQGYLRKRNNKNDHLLASRVEHNSVKRICNQLELEGLDYNIIETDPSGRILLEDLDLLLKPDTALISIMHGNNEIGTLQPLEDVLKRKKT